MSEKKLIDIFSKIFYFDYIFLFIKLQLKTLLKI